MRLAQLAPVLFAFAATACTQLTADDDPDPDSKASRPDGERESERESAAKDVQKSSRMNSE